MRFPSFCFSAYEDVAAFDVFEIAVGADLELVAGGLVADDDAVRVEL